MNREIQAKVLSIKVNSKNTEGLEDIIWIKSEPSGISNEIGKNVIDIYYSPLKFPDEEFVKELKGLPYVESIRKRIIYKRDWNARWQRGVKPVRIYQKFVIVPPFKKYEKAFKGYRKIVINPAMAFGTGHHESTLGIMKLIYKHRMEIKDKRVADFGSGSGILSIFARMLGSLEVDAYDFDPECGRAIEENMRYNKIGGINFFHKPIKYCRRRYDVIFANMLFGEISSNREVFLRSIKKGGLIFFAGILDCERRQMLNMFNDLRLKDEIVINEWRAFLFTRI